MDLHAVFVRGQAEPVAFFSDADQAQRWRRAEHGDAAVVVPVEASVSKSALDAASDAAAASFPAPAATVAASADDVRKGELRAQLAAEERDKRLLEEVRREMTEDAKTARAEAAAVEAPTGRAATAEPVATSAPAVPRRTARE